MARIIIFSIFILLHTPAFAQYVHERVKRITVFPIKTNAEFATVAESTWWDLRERLTESKRFLVASKNFMQAKDVFQARGELQPADALILGRLLDANALITTFLVDRKLSMRVYESKNGFMLWSNDLELHPAVPISQQLPDAAKKMLFDFIASIPYQGYVIVDSLIGKPSFFEGTNQLFKVDVGAGTLVTVGDEVQMVKIVANQYKPIFQEGASIEVYLEGIVTKVDRQIVTVLVKRKQPNVEIAQDALIRVPDELRRIKEMYGMSESSEKSMELKALIKDENELTQKEKETKPLVTSLSWIGNLALVLLLAF